MGCGVWGGVCVMRQPHCFTGFMWWCYRDTSNESDAASECTASHATAACPRGRSVEAPGVQVHDSVARRVQTHTTLMASLEQRLEQLQKHTLMRLNTHDTLAQRLAHAEARMDEMEAQMQKLVLASAGTLGAVERCQVTGWNSAPCSGRTCCTPGCGGSKMVSAGGEGQTAGVPGSAGACGVTRPGTREGAAPVWDSPKHCAPHDAEGECGQTQQGVVGAGCGTGM